MPRRLGQHFLRDPGVVQRILQACGTLKERTVLEIGPGKGALTRPLLDAGAVVHAIEADPDLAHTLPEHDRLHITTGDAVQEPWPATDLLVSNLPYEITSPVLERLTGAPRPAVLMMQREVARRITAAPGGKDMGRLSVGIQLHFTTHRVCRVRPGAFDPPPKVQSEVLRLDPRDDVSPHAGDAMTLAALAFQQRRKQLRNTLGDTPWGDLTAVLEERGLATRRPETLAPGDWVVLAARAAGAT